MAGDPPSNIGGLWTQLDLPLYVLHWQKMLLPLLLFHPWPENQWVKTRRVSRNYYKNDHGENSDQKFLSIHGEISPLPQKNAGVVQPTLRAAKKRCPMLSTTTVVNNHNLISTKINHYTNLSGRLLSVYISPSSPLFNHQLTCLPAPRLG